MAIPDSTAKPDRLIVEPPKRRNLTPLWISLAAFFGLLIGGGVIYLWQAPAAQAERDAAVANTKTELQKRINQLLDSNTECDESLTFAQKKGATTAADITFERKFDADAETTAFTILRDGTKVGSVSLEGEFRAEIFKQTARNAYIGFSLNADAGEDGSVYRAPQKLYRLEFATNTFTPLLQSAGASDFSNPEMGLALSADESRLAYVSESSTGRLIVLVMSLNDDTKPVQSFAAPDRYNAVGDLSFAPNGKNIAFAAQIVGGSKASAAFVGDLGTEAVTQLGKEDTGHLLRIDGWKDNKTPIINSEAFPVVAAD